MGRIRQKTSYRYTHTIRKALQQLLWGSFACAFLFTFPTQTHAQKAKKAVPKAAKTASKRTHKVKIKDVFGLGYIWNVAMSPKGKYAAYIESRWQKASSWRNNDLWLVDTKTRQRTRLTFHSGTEHSAQWGPDGRWLYFLAKRKGSNPKVSKHQQVWRLQISSGRTMAVTRITKSVRSYQLSKDGKSIYYLTSRKHVQKGPFKGLRKRFGKLQYGHGVLHLSQLWRLDLESWRTQQVLKSKRVINSFSVSPDTKKIALLTAPDGKLISNEGWSRIDIYFPATQKTLIPKDAQWRKRAPSPYGWLSHLAWSSDSKQVSFKVSFDGYPAEVFVLGIQGGKCTHSTKIKRLNEYHYNYVIKWQPKSNRLCFLAVHHALTRVYCVAISNGKQGKTTVATAGPQHVGGFSFQADGKRLAVLLNGKTHPPDVFVADFAANQKQYKRLTRVNPQVDTWKFPSIQRVQWKSKDGTRVEGLLELPPGYKKGKKLPLLVLLHGGPTSSVKLRFRMSIGGRTFYASNGWATLSPNYRGSTGYGDKFMTQLIGHKNVRDVEDILSGVDFLVKKGIADPKRMAIMGWSNGGYLVNCLITHTTRFKAASSGAGLFDISMQWMIQDTPGHNINFQKGLPWESVALFRRSSPLYQIHKAKTPTLIHVGQRDARVPPAHSQGLYRALRRYLKVPSELIIYPGEPHGLRKKAHRKAKMLWDHKWLGYYALGKGNKAIQPKVAKKKKAPKPKPKKRTKPKTIKVNPS